MGDPAPDLPLFRTDFPVRVMIPRGRPPPPPPRPSKGSRTKTAMPQPAKAKDVIGGPVWPKETRTPEEVEEVWILGGLELCEPGLFEVGRNSADYRKRRLQNLQRYIELQDDALYAARMGLERVLRPLEQVEGAFRSLMQPAPGRVEK